VIHGYPAQPSVQPGERLTLHVSTDAPAFRTEFFRQDRTLTALGDLGAGADPGDPAPFRPPDEDWGVDGWRGYDFTIPAHWVSGVYIAVLTELDDAGEPISSPDTSTSDGRDSRALFVVRRSVGAAPAPILYKLPLFTWHAYNKTGDPPGSLYTGTHERVSYRRPGGGTGGIPTDLETFPDFYDLASPRETFAHWDAPFIQWLAAAGYRADFCTDLDVHEGADGLLDGYRLLLTVGHDEYWTATMRERVAQFVAGGGNLAVFSGNTCWWQVEFPETAQPLFARTGRWHELGLPENTLTGVSYRHGGGHWDGPRPTEVTGYTVQHADHWVYAGTGLADGDVFGDSYDDGEPAALVGYECDGANFDRPAGGGPVSPTLDDGTPDTFVILATADLTGWSDSLGNHTATLGTYDAGGRVFNAGTSDWPRVLNSGRSSIVDRITRNVIDTLTA
jgi:hypothetical protein